MTKALLRQDQDLEEEEEEERCRILWNWAVKLNGTTRVSIPRAEMTQIHREMLSRFVRVENCIQVTTHWGQVRSGFSQNPHIITY